MAKKQKRQSLKTGSGYNDFKITQVDTKELMQVNLIENSVVATNPTRQFIEAVKEYELLPLETILADPQKYSERFDEKGEVKLNQLVNDIYVAEGKTALDKYRIGERVNYIEIKEKFRELGHESMTDFLKDPDNGLPRKSSYLYNAKKINIRFNEGQCIMLGSKIDLLLTLIDIIDQESNQEEADAILDDIITEIVPMSYRDTDAYLRQYKLGAPLPSPGIQDAAFTVHEGKTDNDDILMGKDLTPVLKPLNIEKVVDPVIAIAKVTKGVMSIPTRANEELEDKNFRAVLGFNSKWEEQVFLMAFRRKEKAIIAEMKRILNEPENEKYRLKALKELQKQENKDLQI